MEELKYFFSYARKDSEFVLKLAKELRTAGANFWLDQLDILGGQRWDHAVEEALKACQGIVVVLSPESLDSDNVMDEVSYALEENKLVVPVLLHGCDIPFRLRRLQYVDFTTDYNFGYSQLLRALGMEQPLQSPDSAASEKHPDKDAVLPFEETIKSEVVEVKRWWQTLPSTLFGLATLIGVVTVLIVVFSQSSFLAKNVDIAESEQESQPIKYERDKYDETVSGALGRITFVTDRMSALLPLETFLEEHGAKLAAVVNSREIGDLSISRPDIVVVGNDTKDVWKNMSKSVLKRMFENYKVIGIGEGGTSLFSQLELDLASVMHVRMPQVMVEIPELLKSPFSLEDDVKLVNVYESDQADVVGVYDQGSLAIAGFEGVARWKDRKNHWPIARQGNYVLWGFLADTNRMTDSGKRLFANLIANHKQQPSVPLSKARRQIEYVKPGKINDVLTSQFSGHTWTFQVSQVGLIRAQLRWNAVEHPLALILNGPGRTGYYARKDGTTSLAIEFKVEDEHLAEGTEWHITIRSFENLGSSNINYNLDLSFP